MEQKQQRQDNRCIRIFHSLRPDGTTAVFAMILSVMCVFAILTVICPSWYESFSSYTELITGITTFSGYNKDADMKIVKVLLFALPVLFLFFCAVIRYLLKRVEIPSYLTCSFFAGCFLFFVQCMNGEDGSLVWGIWLLFVLAGTCILYDHRAYDRSEFMDFLTAALLGCITLQGVGAVFIQMLPSDAARGNGSRFLYMLPSVLTAALLLFFTCLVRFGNGNLKKLISICQIVLPAGLLSMVYFRYDYEGTKETFVLFYSMRYRLLLYLLFFLFVSYAVYGLIRHKKALLPTTVMTVSMLRVFALPEGILSIDFFHIGEMTTPFMQLEAYGKRPLFDLMPIHGLCDYYYSLVDKIFLDDTYLSMNAAITIGNLFLAAFLGFVLYQVCEQKQWALFFSCIFMPFLINHAGIRYIFFFVMFFVLMSERVRKKPMMYLWWYVVLSIVSIAWNMSIGGAGAAAFFLVALFVYGKRALGEGMQLLKKKDRKKIRHYLVLYLVLLGAGLAFVPSFLKIVEYLTDNAGTTLMANGMAMIEDMASYKEYLRPSFFREEEVSFLHVFGFLIPLLICLILLFSGREEKRREKSREFFIIFFICFYIIANYAFVRFDNALRTSVLSIFFIMAFLVGMSEDPDAGRHGEKGYAVWLCLFLLSASMTGQSLSLNVKDMATNKTVPALDSVTIMGREVDDPIVYVTGDSVGMKRLGNGFIRGNTLQNLQNLKYVFDTELNGEKEYLDLTNAVANYVFLDACMGLPYTSGYNISNERMQKNAIRLLQKDPPKLVIVAPYIRFDEATISLRSPLLYEYLYDAGYQPYVYQNVIYLKREESTLYQESNGFEDFAELMHKKSLQMLPAVWGSSEAASLLEPAPVKVEMQKREEEIVCRMEDSCDGDEVDFIMVTLPPETRADRSVGDADPEEVKQEKQQTLELVFGEEDQEYVFSFVRKGDHLLIPVYSSPYWKQQKRITGFRLRMEEGKQIPWNMEDMNITCYRWPE